MLDPVPASLVQERHGHTGESSGPQRWWLAKCISCIRTGWEGRHCLAWKTLRCSQQYVWVPEERGAQGLSQVCSATKQEAVNASWIRGGSRLVSGKTLPLWGCLVTGTGSPKKCGISPLGDIEELPGDGLEQRALNGSAWPGGLGKVTFGGLLQSPPFCDSMTSHFSCL